MVRDVPLDTRDLPRLREAFDPLVGESGMHVSAPFATSVDISRHHRPRWLEDRSKMTARLLIKPEGNPRNMMFLADLVEHGLNVSASQRRAYDHGHAAIVTPPRCQTENHRTGMPENLWS